MNKKQGPFLVSACPSRPVHSVEYSSRLLRSLAPLTSNRSLSIRAGLIAGLPHSGLTRPLTSFISLPSFPFPPNSSAGYGVEGGSGQGWQDIPFYPLPLFEESLEYEKHGNEKIERR